MFQSCLFNIFETPTYHDDNLINLIDHYVSWAEERSRINCSCNIEIVSHKYAITTIFFVSQNAIPGSFSCIAFAIPKIFCDTSLLEFGSRYLTDIISGLTYDGGTDTSKTIGFDFIYSISCLFRPV